MSACRVGWDEAAKHDKNYEQLGFVADANAGFGRNKKASGVGTRSKPNVDDGGHGEGDDMQGEEQEVEENEEALDEDLKAALGRMRSTGKAAPKRLTPHQRQVVEGLVAAHGTNLEAMVLDRKLNKMQHSRGQLQKLIDSFNYWGKGSGVDFRVPHKRLW